MKSEAGYYCLKELNNWINLEFKKSEVRITFRTQHLPSFKVLQLDDKNSLLYDLYMNEEEREAFLCNSLKTQQVITLKLRLQQDDFCCTGSFSEIQCSNMDTRVVLEETFEKM